ncbi:hypothetical protein MKW98_025365 [Papaver atlanticum]|uniref:Uncharacterized protein n=1 Tax=Papaver atlanticum TaxID=357466 RepID=A0AAD4XBY0_9MAGN|nr:hypothetical protein MKW98_028712 [Papaver atlanticum]KAI3932115.1 hypothetical protein MKW98_025365 [Papaver atlanticum]
MGKSGNKKGGGFVNGSSSNQGGGLTLRQQIHGSNSNQKNKFGGSSSNTSNNERRSILKTKHLEKLGLWAADVSIPSLGALFGRRLASSCESLATPVDSSLLLCQRCESILQPGSNCTVRIEKNGSKKKKRRKTSSVPPQNNVVYTCHFCSHRNLKRGTSKSHMKEISPPKPKKAKSDEKRLNLVKTKVDEGKLDMTNVEAIVCPENVAGFKENVAAQICSSSEKATESNNERGKIAEELVPTEYIPIEMSEATVPEMNSVTGKDVASEKIPTTPLNKVPVLLLDSKRKKRTRSHNKQVANESNSPTPDAEKVSTTSNKRRRKSWSSLKELAEANERKNGIANLKIPFCL